jgi:hypothetical protein
VARLMVRLGATSEAAAVHRAFIDAGKAPPFAAGEAAALSDTDTSLTGPEAVALARSTLRRYC